MEPSRHHCAVCGRSHPLMAAFLEVCPECARGDAAIPRALAAHAASRQEFDLPGSPPQSADGVACRLCGAGCSIGEGKRGFCGLRTVEQGRLRHLGGTAGRGILHWYRDPLPTNCVADWICSGSAQRGKHNLAVFYASCSFDCLPCQNWHFRQTDLRHHSGTTAAELADASSDGTFCVCFFGGDPSSQMPHALISAAMLAERGVVVCWETAGSSSMKLIDRALVLSLRTGGCVKFDLKALTEPLHIVLTGVSNEQTLHNFARAAERFSERPEPPPVVASTLLVPGYVDAEEVGRIASFVAEQDQRIPYALLAFAPNFRMTDLPRTSWEHAEAALQAARDAGLSRVRIANQQLLSDPYPRS
ncbi:MAG: radical SAM protein [Planctomycetota bacterium]